MGCERTLSLPGTVNLKDLMARTPSWLAQRCLLNPIIPRPPGSSTLLASGGPELRHGTRIREATPGQQANASRRAGHPLY